MCVTGTRTGVNTLRYGIGAPRPGQRLLIDPGSLTKRYMASKNNHRPFMTHENGLVLNSDWDLARGDILRYLKFRACKEHFCKNTSWEDTGIFDHMYEQIAKNGVYDNCRTRQDVIARYARLDELWDVTVRNKEMPEVATLHESTNDEILVHVDRIGRLLFGSRGTHRLSIAKLAGVKTLPVALGWVHIKAVQSGAYKTLIQQGGI